MKKVGLLIVLVLAHVSLYSQSVNFTVTVIDSLTPISPHIYGTNQLLNGGENWTALRLGGDRLTGYNWENNASNAGVDYLNESDDYLAQVFNISPDSSSLPGIVTEAFHNQALQLGAYTLATLQMAGFVAKDKNGVVDSTEIAPSSRWAYVKFVKGSALSLTPNLSNDTVFMDEYVNFLVNKNGAANSATGIQGYNLDNEPDLWSSSHPRLHPSQTTCQEIIQRSVALAKSVKNIDPSAEIFGPVSYGFDGYYSFQNAPDWSAVSAGKLYTWFLDYYLDQMKKASDTAGRRLLDVLDLHWYSAAVGSDENGITDQAATSAADNAARVQAPRSLWDKSYAENSWIEEYYKSYLPLIPKLMQSINKYYPGTKLSFSEFNYGGENDISGAIAVDDVLGIFAKYGVYFATIWPLSSPSQYISAAYEMYRNYDGANSAFGAYYVPSQTSDSVNCSIYGSTTPGTNEIHLIVINKNYNASVMGNFLVSSSHQILSGRVWELSQSSSKIKEADTVGSISNNSFSYPLETASIYHIVLQTSVATNVAEKNIVPDKFELSQNYPNPFNPSTTIAFDLAHQSFVLLRVYNILGQEVATLVDEVRPAGKYREQWNASNLASGMYFYSIRTGSFAQTRKMLLLK
ncbi:MAG: glycoside hydrolase family 44 protein [Bacteroidota bacterium]